MFNITVIQPPYFAGEEPDAKIAAFLENEAKAAKDSSLILLPEYSNAGGLSDKERELRALPRAKEMKKTFSRLAKERGIYTALNVLEEREGKIKNSTYLFDKKGEVAFVYDKIHLPPSEVMLGVERGSGACVCDLDGIRFAFMTCYDVYFNEQIEYIASQKPDIVLIPGYQRGERTDIILAQAKLTAFRCNAFVARASYSMNDEGRGGNSMIVAPDGQILKNLGKDVGSITVGIDPKEKYMRTAGFGGGMVRNDDFINAGLCPEAFEK
ncbi:MAG: carbon-nitrogen hydrolase family protein [Clostridia bacterium]|nr:carbon-nitrogen hydrolase family protein [Clostridia bacterium]